MAAAGIVLAFWLVAAVWRHGGDDVYDLPSWAVALGVVAGLVAVVGWLLVIRRGRWLGVAVAVVGGLTVASIVVFPLLAVLLFVGGLVAMARASQGAPDRWALVGGLLVALGVPVAALVASDGPVVSCGHDGSVTTSSSFFRGGSSSSGSGSSAASASASSSASSSSGVLDQGGRHYTYRCAGGRLAEFSVS